MDSSSPQPPASVTDLRINALGFACFVLATAWVLRDGREVSPLTASALLMGAYAAPIVLLDLLVRRVHQRPSTGLTWDRPLALDPARLATKLLGFAACLGSVGAVYFLAPEYQGSFYDDFYAFLWWLGPAAALAAVPWFAWMDGRMAEPRDAYWHLGRLLLGDREVDLRRIADLARGWVVKGFFVPLMYTYLCGNIADLRRLTAADPTSWLGVYDALWSFGFLTDITITTTGYLLTLRLLDTHLRSAQPSMTGWVVALVCYQPFWSLISAQYIAYDNGYAWGEWLEGTPWLKALWAVVLLGTLVVFSGSTLTFGVRFSNLTNRGVITGGFYRYTKHPAYISKCVSFWMICIPFIAHDGLYTMARDCTWLAGICVVYWLRARTEEQHLSEDPDYVRYALWMNEHGLFAPLGRWIPLLRYRPPEDRPSPERRQ